MKTQKVWFVTGASKGLGLTLVKQLLKQGYRVAATSRNITDLTNAVNAPEDQFLALAVDLKTEEQVNIAVQQTMATFGRIDVVVNNAGYGLTGALEELSDREARDNFDINVFGSLNVIRQVMPHLRTQKSGHIFNISSIGGFTGLFPGFGVYCATKFAVMGFTEALAEEVKSLGIHATVVLPGYFRTSFLTNDSLRTPANEIAEYKEVRNMQDMHQHDINGQQMNDPEKGAAVLITIAESKNPPLHLFLGQDAYDMAVLKIGLLRENLETYKPLIMATGFELDLNENAAKEN